MTDDELILLASEQIQRGEAREAYENLMSISPVNGQYPLMWYLRMAESHCKMHSVKVAQEYMREFCMRFQADSKEIAIALAQLDLITKIPLNIDNFGSVDRKNLLTIDRIRNEYPEKTLRTEKSGDEFLTYFLDANIIKPMGIIGWQDSGIIVQESTKNIEFYDVCFSLLMVGESLDPTPIRVKQAVSLVLDYNSHNEMKWLSIMEPRIRWLNDNGYTGVFFAPLEYDWIGKTLSKYGISSDRVYQNDEVSVIAEEALLFHDGISLNE